MAYHQNLTIKQLIDVLKGKKRLRTLPAATGAFAAEATDTFAVRDRGGGRRRGRGGGRGGNKPREDRWSTFCETGA